MRAQTRLTSLDAFCVPKRYPQDVISSILSFVCLCQVRSLVSQYVNVNVNVEHNNANVAHWVTLGTLVVKY